MEVGYSVDGYAERRNFIKLIHDVNYKKIYGINFFTSKIRSVLIKNFLKNQHSVFKDYDFCFYDFNMNKVDIIHLFNSISYGNTPWITTFETIIPRFLSGIKCHHGINCGYASLANDKKILKALDCIVNKPCKKIIALSKCNLLMQKEFLRQFPDYFSEIEHKLTVMHPPQNILLDKNDYKLILSNDIVKFMFVGSLFFTKGGSEIIEVFCDLKNNFDYKFELIIISNFALDNYATEKSKKDIELVKSVIDKNKDWITYYEYLPNSKVIDLMRISHVGLLPSYAETYGYSVLEFQASGCPVISTNIRALPEINNNETGWLIDVPKNRLGEAIYTTEEDRDRVKEAIKKGLLRAIHEIMVDPHIVSKKANAALSRIANNHSPENFAQNLNELYIQSLQ